VGLLRSATKSWAHARSSRASSSGPQQSGVSGEALHAMDYRDGRHPVGARLLSRRYGGRQRFLVLPTYPCQIMEALLIRH
jgi:hypothetical protein